MLSCTIRFCVKYFKNVQLYKEGDLTIEECRYTKLFSQKDWAH